MVTKFGGQILATKFGFAPDCSEHFSQSAQANILYNEFKNYTFKTLTIFSKGQWVKLVKQHLYAEKAHHYSDVIMSVMASQITKVLTVYLTLCSGVDERKHQGSVSPVASEFPAQRASNTENVSIWWRHHAISQHRG